jgi:hypothetical protein
VPSQQLSDIDGDGLGDVCDPDDDEALSSTQADNCPTKPNEDQAEHQRDGIGDECQDADATTCSMRTTTAPSIRTAARRTPTPTGREMPARWTATATDWTTPEDNCPFVSNKSQADADRDGVGNACDKCAAVARRRRRFIHHGDSRAGIPPQPFQPDSDGDGTPDACDRSPFGPERGWSSTTSARTGRRRSSRAPDETTRIEVAGPPGARILLPLSLGARNCRNFPKAWHFDLSSGAAARR